MCSGSTPKLPDALPEAPTMPQPRTPRRGDDAARRRRAAAGGPSGTVLTSPRGVQQSAATATKTLLGQ
jgi:hypothetical protein